MSDLTHFYDPVARREYYLRTRHLLGRAGKEAAALALKKHAPKKLLPKKKTHAQRQKELAHRVDVLKARLEKLQTVLKSLTEAAQKRSGIEKNTSEKHDQKESDKKSSSNSGAKEHKTQKQKNDAAKASKKYNEEHKPLTEQVHDLNNKIKAIQERIKRLRKTGSVGVSKTTSK